MKKLFLILIIVWTGILSSLFLVFASQSVGVSATVGSLNHSPVITSFLPADDPKLLRINKTQNYSVYFRDDEKDTIYYTITPVNGGGYVNLISGTIRASDYDSANGAYINFVYSSPSVVPSPNPTTVTVTLNDGPNLVNKDIHLHIY